MVHPGHGPLGEASFAQVARALARVVSQVPPPPLVLLENTAGQGQELGWRFEHLERIITVSRVPLGLCLDTAHAHGAGYDLSLPAGVARLLADLARGPGLGRGQDRPPQRLPGHLQFPAGPPLAPGPGRHRAGGPAALIFPPLVQARGRHHGDPETAPGL